MSTKYSALIVGISIMAGTSLLILPLRMSFFGEAIFAIVIAVVSSAVASYVADKVCGSKNGKNVK